MSGTDEISRALLEGTLGIARHGVAAPGAGPPPMGVEEHLTNVLIFPSYDDIDEARSRIREIRYSFRDVSYLPNFDITGVFVEEAEPPPTGWVNNPDGSISPRRLRPRQKTP
jgi:hypothetical protein